MCLQWRLISPLYMQIQTHITSVRKDQIRCCFKPVWLWHCHKCFNGQPSHNGSSILLCIYHYIIYTSHHSARGRFGFSVLPKDMSTCRQEGLNFRPALVCAVVCNKIENSMWNTEKWFRMKPWRARGCQLSRQSSKVAHDPSPFKLLKECGCMGQRVVCQTSSVKLFPVQAPSSGHLHCQDRGNNKLISSWYSNGIQSIFLKPCSLTDPSLELLGRPSCVPAISCCPERQKEDVAYLVSSPSLLVFSINSLPIVALFFVCILHRSFSRSGHRIVLSLLAFWALIYSKAHMASFSWICSVQYQGDLCRDTLTNYLFYLLSMSGSLEMWGPSLCLTGRLNRKNTVPHLPHAPNRGAEGRVVSGWPAAPWSSGL